jgi:hypothetical protein
MPAAGYSVSPSNAKAEALSQDTATYITFGGGYIDAPNSAYQTPTATATQGGAAGTQTAANPLAAGSPATAGGSKDLLLYGIVGILGLWFVLHLRKKP